jgi:ribonuclease HI
MAACCDFTDSAIDVAAMEASALSAGLQLVEQFGPSLLMVESDSMEVVQAVLDPSEFRGTSAVVIDDCRHTLTVLGKATIQHCPREANEAAHELAHHGSLERVKVFWFLDPPTFIIPVIVKDRVLIE